MNKTAIVILNWNGLDYLKLFLGTVIRHSLDYKTIIYVADNGSTDGSPEWVEENFKEATLIRLDKNYGFAEGYNLAIESIKAKYFVLLNSDIEVTEGWLKPLVSFMDNNPDVASCQPKILSYHHKGHFEYAGAAGGFIDKYGFTFCRGRIFERTEVDRGQYDTSIDIFWSSGACMIIRPDAWKRCGGFDPDFFAHMEEIDLCWRFHKAGYRVSYVHDSVVYHVGGGTLPYDSHFKTYLNFRNSLFLLYKNLPDWNFHNIMIIRKLLDGLAAMRFLFKGKPGCSRSVWKAHIDYYKSLNKLREKRKKVKELDTDPFQSPLLNKSVVIEFYVKGNKTYDRLKGIN
jgi:GT2 family glycosyltransferase